MITATVDRNTIKIDQEELMTSGSVKTNFIKFVFSSDWKGLIKTAIFQTKKVSIPVIVDGEDKVAIPWEAMAFPKEEIRFGVYGVRSDNPDTEEIDEEIVLPTIWGSLGKVVEGVLVECPPITEPTKDAYLQLLKYIKNLQAGGGGMDQRVSDGTIFVGSLNVEPDNTTYPFTFSNFIGMKPSVDGAYPGLLVIGDDIYLSTISAVQVDEESDIIQVRFNTITKLTNEPVTGGMPYVDQLVAPHDTYSAHDINTIVDQSLYYSGWNYGSLKVYGDLKVGKEFAAYFLYDGEQLNPTLNYYGIFICDEYTDDRKDCIKATLKSATLIGNRTESLNSFLTFFKLYSVPTVNTETSVPFKNVIGLMPQWMNTLHRGLMTVGDELYLIDFRLERLDHDNETFIITFTGIHPISNTGATGPAGPNGITFVPNVSSDGVLSWMNDGGLENPEPVNIKGPAGTDGVDGEDALVYSEILPFDNVTGDPAPLNLYSFRDDGGRFNRTPKLNETWTGVIIYYSGAVGEKAKDVFVSTFKITGVAEEGYTSLLIDKKSVMPSIVSDEPAQNTDSFVTIKDQTITTPAQVISAIGLESYTGCIHAINTSILDTNFANDIVWVYYRRVSGIYGFDFVTADGHIEAWTSAAASTPFSRTRRTDFLAKDKSELAEGTSFIGYYDAPPEVGFDVSAQPNWFIGKKPEVGRQYKGEIRTADSKWYDMTVNMLGTSNNEGPLTYNVRVVGVTEIGKLPAGGTTGQILAKKTDDNYDAEWVDAPSGGSGDSSVLVKSPIGTIVIWSGTVDNIPTGWQLCDGTNGTPDLRDKFVLGAGTSHAVGSTGGSEEVTLTVAQMPSHNHSYYTSNSSTPVGSGSAVPNVRLNDVQQNTNPAGSSKPHPNMPPYYTLCYIMKLTADPAVDGITMDEVGTAIDTKLDAYEPQEVYSTEETRIGTWIDGKPLYRRIVEFNTPSTANPSSSASVYTFQATMTPKKLATFVYPADNGIYPISFLASINEYIMCFIQNSILYIRVSSSLYVNKRACSIVEYTKTTDQAPTAVAATNSALPKTATFNTLNTIQSTAVTANATETSTV